MVYYHFATVSLYIFSAISVIMVLQSSSCTSESICEESKVWKAVYVLSKLSSGWILLVKCTLTRIVSLVSEAYESAEIAMAVMS